ncbi:MAG: HEAT repeat domain-containing protein [Sphingomonadaceae bacterium]
MQANAELKSWIGDFERQHAMLERLDAFDERWKKHPIHRAFVERLDSLDGREEILEAALDFMRRFARSPELIAGLIAEAGNDPYFRPPFYSLKSDLYNGLLLLEHEQLSIVLSVIGVDELAAKKSSDREQVTIPFIGSDNAYHFLKAGGATLSIWEAPPVGADFSVGQSSRCRLREQRRMEDGDTLVIDGRSESFSIDHATSDIVYLHAALLKDAAPVTVEYDHETLRYVSASATHEVSSRLQLMATLLRVADRQDAAPAFAELTEKGDFFTRWHVMREFLALDAEAALPCLRRMADSDPHPEVRETARRTLEMIEAGETEDEKCPA